jgi:hypothetical protein
MPVEPGRSYIINNQPYGLFDQNGQPRDPFGYPPNGFPLVPFDPNFPNFPHVPFGSPLPPPPGPLPGIVAMNNGVTPLGLPMSPFMIPPASNGKDVKIFFESQYDATAVPAFTAKWILPKVLNPRSNSYGLYSESNATDYRIRSIFKDIAMKKTKCSFEYGGFTFDLYRITTPNDTKIQEMINNKQITRLDVTQALTDVDPEAVGYITKMKEAITKLPDSDFDATLGAVIPGTDPLEQLLHKIRDV